MNKLPPETIRRVLAGRGHWSASVLGARLGLTTAQVIGIWGRAVRAGLVGRIPAGCLPGRVSQRRGTGTYMGTYTEGGETDYAKSKRRRQKREADDDGA